METEARSKGKMTSSGGGELGAAVGEIVTVGAEMAKVMVEQTVEEIITGEVHVRKPEQEAPTPPPPIVIFAPEKKSPDEEKLETVRAELAKAASEKKLVA